MKPRSGDSMCILRDYQNTAVSSARESIVSGHKRPLIVLPTGSGKSLIYGEIINLAVSKGKTCLFLVHRRNLVRQFAETLDKHFGITAGVIMAGEEFIQGNQVYVSTVQTYHRRMQLDELQYNHFFIDADIVLTDESHTSISKRYQDIYSAYQDKVIIGTTATPVRADGRGLGEIYDDLISIIDVGELTEKGYLCPVKYYAPTEIDLSKIKLEMGDYDKKAIGAKMDKPKLVGDVVQNWLKLAENRKTIVFAVNVKHSIHLRDEFIRAGIPAMHLDAKSGDDEREYAFKEMDEGRIKVICNVALYIEGMDVPDISCVVMARPTKSLGLFRQCVGRGLRPSPGKENLILLDFAGVISEHGYITDPVEWFLDGNEKAWKKKEREKKDKQPMKCPTCHAIFEATTHCPDCGSEMKKFGRKVEAVDGELVEHKGKKSFSPAEKRRWFGMFEWYRRQKGYKSGWTAWSYKDKTGVWPRGMDSVSPIEPDETFFNWIKYTNIRKAKSKGTT